MYLKNCHIGRLYTRGRVIRLDELGQTFLVRLVIRLSSVKTGTRRIIRLDELSSVVHRSSREPDDQRIFTQVRPDDNRSSSIKTAIVCVNVYI